MRVVRGRQAMPVRRRKNDVHTARKTRPVLFPLFDEMAGQRGRRDQRRALDARAFEKQIVAGNEALDLQDQRGRAIGIFLRPLREVLEGNQPCRVGNEGEMRVGRRVGERRAGVKSEPACNRRRLPQRRIEPERRVVVAKRQRDGRGDR